MKINLLLCDTFQGLLPPAIPSYASMFENLFRSVLDSYQVQIFPVMEGTLPSTFKENELYLITGCNRSVYEEVPWIRNLLLWIRKAHSHKAHVAGICFGHQAIAQALGGEVQKFNGGWGSGIRESKILDRGLENFFPCSNMHLLYNHHDQVTRLPKDATPLATSDFCKYEAFRIDNHILAFQGHPEYTTDYELHLLRSHAENEDEIVKREALESIRKFTPEGIPVARYIVSLLS